MDFIFKTKAGRGRACTTDKRIQKELLEKEEFLLQKRQHFISWMT